MTDRFSGVLTFHGLTDVGLRRKCNEDSFGMTAELGLAVVCDGMGGHDGGDVASALAVEIITSVLGEEDGTDDPTLDPASQQAAAQAAAESGPPAPPPADPDRIQRAISVANARIFSENMRRGFREGEGMGTTVAALVVGEEPRSALVFHVGDSRVYRFSDGTLSPVTQDHTLFEAWRARGCEGVPPGRNVITRALGPTQDVEADVQAVTFDSGDLVLLCSDGLNSMVSDNAIEHALREFDTESDLDAVCRRLISLALEAGGKDNVTVLVGRWH